MVSHTDISCGSNQVSCNATISLLSQIFLAMYSILDLAPVQLNVVTEMLMLSIKAADIIVKYITNLIKKFTKNVTRMKTETELNDFK